MKNKDIFCELKPYIQPFERVLAVRELASLTNNRPLPQPDDTTEPLTYRVQFGGSIADLTSHLTYWERVYTADAPTILTRQVRREATTNIIKNGLNGHTLQPPLPAFTENISLPNRRNLRYGPHGIHEYRGKFFPQLVRALLNIAQAKPTSIIFDPTCGSGTTPTEAVLFGCQAFGLDMNPLSVLMSQVKCDILQVSPSQLVDHYQALHTDVTTLPTGSTDTPWFDQLPTKDRSYLARWFAPQVLTALDPIMTRIQAISHPKCRDLFLVSLSNILRCVSWQKDDDLRVRKEIRDTSELDVKTIFLKEIERSVKTILPFLVENQGFPVGQAEITVGDARQAHHLLAQKVGAIDAIITSPPYATALPYLDTDRLSLCYLGLLSRPDHRPRDYDMIGNREITTRQRASLWATYQQQRHLLPDAITQVIDLIDRLNRQADVGFRRKNLAALLARYFLDMRQVLQTFLQLLKPNAPAYLVVGNNHTIAGGQRVDIETNQLLAQLGESVGLVLEETIPMEMLVSRDIFKQNASNAESILFFRNIQS